jgi:hypothetical protein
MRQMIPWLGVMPSDLTLDRVYVHGDPREGQKRGVALNSARTTITTCLGA